MILEIDVASVFGAAGLVACVELEDGKVENVVLDASGKSRREFLGRPVRLKLDVAPGHADGDPRAPAPGAELVTVEQAFDEGVTITSDRVALHLSWDGRCHGENHPVERKEGRGRFASWEHIKTAERIGLDANGAPFTDPVSVTHESPFPIGGTDLHFGDIICLAGDFYAHFDGETAGLFASAWPPLTGFEDFVAGDYRAPALCEDAPKAITDLLASIHKEGQEKSPVLKVFENLWAKATGDHPTRRYLALASQNYCHFGSSHPQIANEALGLYRKYHARALAQAAAVRALPAGTAQERRARQDAWLAVMSLEAFGCHFLTDLFATGHMRTPRRRLGEYFGVLRGALRMSAGMHDEDNERGLWCTTRLCAEGKSAGARIVWRAYGDGRLLADDACEHLTMVREAVRRSVAELYDAYAGRATPEADRAEAYIPVPLPPGATPSPGDRLPSGGAPAAEAPNHYPKYALCANGHIGQRVGESAHYRDIEDANTPRLTWNDAVRGPA